MASNTLTQCTCALNAFEYVICALSTLSPAHYLVTHRSSEVPTSHLGRLTNTELWAVWRPSAENHWHLSGSGLFELELVCIEIASTHSNFVWWHFFGWWPKCTSQRKNMISHIRLNYIIAHRSGYSPICNMSWIFMAMTSLASWLSSTQCMWHGEEPVKLHLDGSQSH